MTRYTPAVNFRLGQYGDGHVDMREDPTGEWVRFSDVPTFRAAADKLGEETVMGMRVAALVEAAKAAAKRLSNHDEDVGHVEAVRVLGDLRSAIAAVAGTTRGRA